MRSVEEIKERLKTLEGDERISYPPASIEINGPLALIQLSIGTQIDLLNWVLKEEGEEI